MQFPPSMMSNMKSLDIEAMKAEQKVTREELLRGVDMRIAEPSKETFTSQVERFYGSERGREIFEKIGVGDAEFQQRKENALNQAREWDGLGFKPQASEGLKNWYDKVQAGETGGRYLGDHNEDQVYGYASRALSALSGAADIINRYGTGDPSLEGEYTGYVYEAPVEDGYEEFKQMMQRREAVNRDWLEASRLKLVTVADELAKTFGIEEPIYEVVDGEVKIRSFDISYQGEKIAHSAGGSSVRYDENGVLKMDKTV